MTCTHCGTEIAAKALICYRCGRGTVEPRVAPPETGSIFARSPTSRMPLIALAVVVVLAMLAAWYFDVVTAAL